ncbi:MAG: hypothetical protein JOZ73_02275 [Solirubrobacterales bacterium]|nr:hypothetical protein [Solirubrobacterales bacterium]
MSIEPIVAALSDESDESDESALERRLAALAKRFGRSPREIASDALRRLRRRGGTSCRLFREAAI